MRVVLDTNLLISALISPDGTPARVIRAWIANAFLLISHEEQLGELRDVTRRTAVRYLIRRREAGELVNRIKRIALQPDSLPHVERSPDPRDDFLLALCEAGRADWLVSGDKRDLLALRSHGRTQIVSARAFADHLAG